MTSGTVVVLCAEWCGVCREFKDPFEELARALPEWRLGWVDIEAHPATEDVELESLPSLIVTGPDEKVIFLGPVVPRPSAIEQLLRGLKNHSPLALSHADAQWINAVLETSRDTHG
ncbi:thioredoxin family protein [Zwartia panacis]|uniref:thioredoxin family protein n=1 Tax=Zwartia panacis TaxID=2683345 RepID=UPI00338EB7D0